MKFKKMICTLSSAIIAFGSCLFLNVDAGFHDAGAGITPYMFGKKENCCWAIAGSYLLKHWLKDKALNQRDFEKFAMECNEKAYKNGDGAKITETILAVRDTISKYDSSQKNNILLVVKAPNGMLSLYRVPHNSQILLPISSTDPIEELIKKSIIEQHRPCLFAVTNSHVLLDKRVISTPCPYDSFIKKQADLFIKKKMENLPFLICETIKERTLGETRNPVKFTTHHTDDGKDIEMENLKATFEKFIDKNKNNKNLLSCLSKACNLSKHIKKSGSKIHHALPLYTILSQSDELKNLIKDLKSAFIDDQINIPGDAHMMVINGCVTDESGRIKEIRINIISNDDNLAEKEMMLKIDEFKKIADSVATIIN